MKKIILLTILTYIVSGCSQHQLVRKEDIRKNQNIELLLYSGERVTGKVAKVDDQEIIVVDSNGEAWRAKKSAVKSVGYSSEPRSAVSGPSPRSSQKVWVYTLSGGLLSMGTGFFLSSMASRGVDEDMQGAVIYGGTAVTTLAGGYIFSRMGTRSGRKKKNRTGVSDELLDEHQKQTRLKEEIEKVKKERERQEAEKQELLKKLNEPDQ